MLQAFISSVDVTSDAVGNLDLIFHYVGAAGLWKQTESNIKINFLPTPVWSAGANRCDVPLQGKSSGFGPAFRDTSWIAPCLRTFCKRCSLLLIDCTGRWAWLSARCFQGKWRPRARKKTTTTMTARRARWMRCVQLIRLLFKYIECQVLRLPSSGQKKPLLHQWDFGLNQFV